MYYDGLRFKQSSETRITTAKVQTEFRNMYYDGQRFKQSSETRITTGKGSNRVQKHVLRRAKVQTEFRNTYYDGLRSGLFKPNKIQRCKTKQKRIGNCGGGIMKPQEKVKENQRGRLGGDVGINRQAKPRSRTTCLTITTPSSTEI
nr:hypothetical protein BgiMline_023205 [Biomphalaria glabrata]